MITDFELSGSVSVKVCICLLACFSLGGCVGANISKVENSQSKPTLTYTKPVVLTSTSSALVNAIAATPAVSSAISSAEATKERVAVARTQKQMTVSASGSSGFETDTDDGSEGVLVVGVTAQKLLSDNGKTDRAIYLSELLAETARLESQISFDQALQQVLDAHITRNTALEVDSIISHYLDLFNEREELVQRAVDAGVLSNSDYLELQSLKNEILSEQARSVFQSNASTGFLKTSLGGDYSEAMAELSSRYVSEGVLKLSSDNSNQVNLLGLKEAQVQTEIELQQLSKTLTTSWQASISSPKSRGAGSTLFAGITMGLPINDGGKAKATLVALRKELNTNALELATFEQEVSLAQQGLDDFLTYYDQEIILLNDRKRISEARIVELEQKLKSGRVNVSELAKEFISLARTEIAIERLDFDRKAKTLSALSVTSQTCELVRLCDAIGTGNSK